MSSCVWPTGKKFICTYTNIPYKQVNVNRLNPRSLQVECSLNGKFKYFYLEGIDVYKTSVISHL